MDWILTKIEQHTASVSEYYARIDRTVHRDRNIERYNIHSGSVGSTSLRTIWRSPSQVKLVIVGSAWYAFQVYAFMVMANVLVHVTFHDIAPTSPSYPGKMATAGTNPFKKDNLFDLGFHYTPDLSYRPWWLKAAFVDLNVFLAQVCPPILLVLTGQTKRFVTYVGTIGVVNICKGVIQVITILPPANNGQGCWEINFSDAELETVRAKPWTWVFSKTWGMTHGCNDMVWSGHTVQSCIGFLFIVSCLKREGVAPWLIHVSLFAYFCGYVWSVLACRMHYSVDVLVAAMIGYFVYTHAGFRQFLWTTANRICCNAPFDDNAKGFNQIPQALRQGSE